MSAAASNSAYVWPCTEVLTDSDNLRELRFIRPVQDLFLLLECGLLEVSLIWWLR